MEHVHYLKFRKVTPFIGVYCSTFIRLETGDLCIGSGAHWTNKLLRKFLNIPAVQLLKYDRKLKFCNITLNLVLVAQPLWEKSEACIKLNVKVKLWCKISPENCQWEDYSSLSAWTMNRRVNNVLFLNCNQGNNVVCYTSVGENKCEFVLLVRLPEYVYEPSLLLLFMSFSISFLQQHKLLSASSA